VSEVDSSYDGADRLTGLSHVFATASSNFSWQFGYDAAGRELSQTQTNAALSWRPAVASTSYGTASNLNQYPSVGLTYSWWPEGALENDGQITYYYDEQNVSIRREPPSG
jgi:YD repeat-containing protein